MVTATSSSILLENLYRMELPVIDLLAGEPELADVIIKACENYGFFKVVNHGIDDNIIAKMEEESVNFFAKSAPEKQLAGPANPFGYGCRNIGFNGDMGEVEYLLLHTSPMGIAQNSKTISNDPAKFSSAVSNYVEAIRELASEILIQIAKGLRIPNVSVLSNLIKDQESDSLLRLNHYPTHHCKEMDTSVGFGEHSDPQILTILRSNDVGGLEICLNNGIWIPVDPDPSAFFVNVGDALQVMSNGRLVSVRHRVMNNRRKPRMSMAYFGAPPLDTRITCLQQMGQPNCPLYRPFTWAEYKKASYSLGLGDSRLQLFKTLQNINNNNLLL